VDSHTYTYNQRDDLDNWILDQTQPDPTRADILNDGSGNDRMRWRLGAANDDAAHAWRVAA